MKICVIGAGIVGCMTAYRLAQLGCDVRLVDAASEAGTGTSFANGAQLSYSFVEPLASPATLWSIPKMLLAPDSPLRFEFRADPAQWAWGLRFLMACTKRQAMAGTRELLRLASLSRATLDSWMAEENWSFGYRMNGKLVLCPDAATLDRQRKQIRFQQLLGRKQEVVSAADCLSHEPSLAAYAGSFVGGVYTADECVGDPYQLCGEVVRSLRRMGVSLRFDTPITQLVTSNGRVVAARSSQEEFAADAFVVSAGCQSVRLARSAGVRLPIYPIKGYSVTLQFREGKLLPRASVTDLGRKTVFAPLGGALRVAAMAEVVGDDLSIPLRRIEQMLESVETVFPGLCDLQSAKAWAGLRPATPKSTPITGPTHLHNLFINSGHGALGFTLAAGSAEVLAREMLPGSKAVATVPTTRQPTGIGPNAHGALYVRH
jgi:D-amino-acid dehydrogenase